jgi:uncharacterized protein
MLFFSIFWLFIVAQSAKIMYICCIKWIIMDAVGRTSEIKTLGKLYESKNSEFLAIYGRRRVGKTYLIREYFHYTFDFQISGLANGNTAQQLMHFHQTLDAYNKTSFDQAPQNWIEAFNRLKLHVGDNKSKRKIIFIDEMPWMDTLKSDFIIALESFWNDWATNRKDIFLIASGSASSWILSKLINNTGGLHNRITNYIKLHPFTLAETEEFLKQKNCTLNRYQIAELYMAVGGIPYYLNYALKGQSTPQIIESLFFEKEAKLKNEFNNLYKSLFKKHIWHEKIVEALASSTKGLTRNELLKLTNLPSGGTISKILNELEESGFIQSYQPLSLNIKNISYRLSDFYTAFYFKFIKDAKYKGKDAWTNMIDNPTHRVWQGYTFEQLCIYHIDQIKSALGISGILSREASWIGEKAQIDLVIDRRDDVVNVCEMKFSLNKYSITKEYDEKLRNKIQRFKDQSKTKKSVFLTMVTTYGLAKNKYSGLVQNEIMLDQLFVEK